MCGRMNVIDDPNVRAFMDALGIPVYPKGNIDLRPTDETLLLVPNGKNISTATMSWGIQPSWSKKLLINAKSETISDKTTFKQAFEQHRALVVCSGWYEWKDEAPGEKKAKKQKYLVQHSLKQPMLMAAVCFPVASSQQEANQETNQNRSQFVTLTTAPNEKLKQVHHRMPLIIHSDEMDEWLLGGSQQALDAIHPMENEAFQFEAC